MSSDDYAVFVRQARDAAHEALFFLGMLYKTTEPNRTRQIESYAPFALSQVARLFGKPFAPTDLANDSQRRAVKAWSRAVDSAQFRAEPLPDDPPPLVRAAEAREALRDFLRLTRPPSLGRRVFQQWLPDLTRYLAKHLALLFAVGLVGFAILGVEAVRSLVWIEGWKASLPLALAVFPALLAKAWIWLARMRHLRRRHRERAVLRVIPWWDIGGLPFRSWRDLALEPGRGVRRWQDPPTEREAWWKGLLLAIPRVIRTLRKPRTMLDAVLAGPILRFLCYVCYFLIAWAFAIYISLGPEPSPGVTLFLIFSVLFAVVHFAHTVDFWDFIDPLPIRLVALSIGLVLLAGLLAGLGRLSAILVTSAGTLVLVVSYFRNRSRPLRLLVALSFALLLAGNLSAVRTDKAAVWPIQGTDDGGTPAAEESRCWGLLPVKSGRPIAHRIGPSDWPRGTAGDPVVVMAASGGGSRAAIYTALTLEKLEQEYSEIAGALQAISSVSGGSLASAAWIAKHAGAEPPPPPDWPVAASSLRSLVPTTDRLVESVSELVQLDFLRPTLLGALVPGCSRGDAIETSWRRRVGLGNLSIADLIHRWRASTDVAPPFPLPLFNSSTLDGHCVVISPLDKLLYASPNVEFEARERNWYTETRRLHGAQEDEPSTWVFYRDAVYGLEDLLPTYDPPLSSAVRASANFPFGFPLVKIRPESPHWSHFSPPSAFPRNTLGWKVLGGLLDGIRDSGIVELTDGGALSNSGMWSLFNLLMPPSGGSAARGQESSLEKALDQRAKMHAELKGRGVLLLIVEASKMPSYPSVWKSERSLLGTLGDQSPIGQYLHRAMIDRLEREYGDALAVVQIDLPPLERHNVLTTWSLSSDKIAQLRKAHDERWRQLKPDLAERWRFLKKRAAEREVAQPFPQAKIDRARPPLD